jgi:nitrous oxidase accessory protein NosD
MKIKKFCPIAAILFLILVSSTASAGTLQVGSKLHYKTIQSAIDAAHDGDTIKVSPGTYKENLQITNKKLTIIGTNYPAIYGARMWGGVSGMLYGFSIKKNGVIMSDGVNMTIRNCAFTNCGIDITGQTCIGNILLNNKITNGGISLYESKDTSIIGNYIYKCNTGLDIRGWTTCKTITKNKFSNCQVAVLLDSKGMLTVMKGNTYTRNELNIKLVPSIY